MMTFKFADFKEGPDKLIQLFGGGDVFDELMICEDAPIVIDMDRGTPKAYFVQKEGCDVHGDTSSRINSLALGIEVWNAFKPLGHYGIYCNSDALYVADKVDLDKKLPDAVFEAIKAIPVYEPGAQQMINLGVELEVEHDRHTRPEIESELENILGPLYQDVTGDGSVRGGTEIRFGHPELKNWDKERIENMMKFLRKNKFNNRTSTAGMHIHMSADSDLATRYAANRCLINKDKVLAILYPICARKAKVRGVERTDVERGHRYGLGKNFTRGYTYHKTLEIRVWEATTNPKVFMARLKFADYFMRFLCAGLPFADFFKNMSKADKRNYAFLLRTNNPHVFGIGKDEALKLLNEEA